MSSSTPATWTWDPTRKDHFYYSPEEDAWVYQSGLRVKQTAQVAKTEDNARPRTSVDAQLQQRTNDYDTTRDRAQSGPTQYTTGVGGLTQQLGSLELQSASALPSDTYDNTSTYAESSHTYATSPQTSYANIETQSSKTVASTKGRARGLIKASDGDTLDHEKLDPNYKRRNGRTFFVVGKVFRVLWPEVAGYTVNENITVISDVRFRHESFVTKIRWFVVVKENDNCAICLPILTYGNQGVSKEGAVKWKHAIAFTGKKDHEPAAHASEQPALREYGMMSPIRVRPRTKQEKLHTMSRINFSKIYTVEHNVKVYDFGVVHPDYVSRLKTQWRYVLDHEGEGHPSDLVIETPQPQPIYTPQSYASPQYAIPQTHNPQPYGTTQTYGAPQHQPYAQPQTYPSAGAYPGYAQPTMQSYNTAAPTQTTQMAQGYGTSTSQTTQSYAVSTTQAYHTSSSQAHVMPWAQEYNTRTAQEYNIQPTSNSWAAQQHHQKDDSDDE